MAIDWYAKDYLAKRGLDVKIEVVRHTGTTTALYGDSKIIVLERQLLISH